MSYVLGFDASTQSVTATLVDCSQLSVEAELSVNFGQDLPEYKAPSGFIPGGENGEVHADPLMWLDALDLLFSRMVKAAWPLDQVVSISGSGQQHGSVYLKASFEDVVSSLSKEKSLSEQIRPTLSRKTSPIWMDASTRAECDEIAATVGDDAKVCELSGSIAIERFTGPQIRRFAKKDPAAYAETKVIHLVSSFFASVLAGENAAMDRGDAAGMNLMNLASFDWDSSLVAATAEGLAERLPAIKDSSERVGSTASYFTEKYGLNTDAEVFAWSGDNPCSLVGMAASSPGRMVISLGTSDTLFAAMPEPVTDPNGFGHVFGNPMGGYMSLICFLNGSLARERVKDDLNLSWDDFDVCGLEKTPAGNDGRLMLPFFGPEITPKLNVFYPPVTNGWNVSEVETEAQVRAVLEGQFLNMRLHSEWLGVDAEQILLTGGASENDGIAQIIADVFGARVVRMKSTGSASLGAAIRAAVAANLASLDTLEKSLCELDGEKTIHCDADRNSVYTQMLPEFAELIKSQQ